MNKNIAVISVDGSGWELTKQSIKVLDAIARQFKHSFHYQYATIHSREDNKTSVPLPDKVLKVCLNSDAILLGATGKLALGNHLSPATKPDNDFMDTRNELGLYVNIKPVIAYSHLYHLSPLKNNLLEKVDFIIIKLLIAGIYPAKELLDYDRAAVLEESKKQEDQVEKGVNVAFSFAQQRKKLLTIANNSNISEETGLWLQTVQKMALQYADVKIEYVLIESVIMQMATNPKRFDIIVAENRPGNILCFAAGIICPLPGLLPSASFGDKLALFTPDNCSTEPFGEKNMTNPLGNVFSAAMMLDYFDMKEEAALVREAVQWTFVNGFVTKDVDPINNYSTSTIGELLTDYVEDRIPSRINKENMVISKSTII